MSEQNMNNEQQGQENKGKDFLKKNKTLVILLAVLALVVLAGVLINLSLNQPEQAVPNNQQFADNETLNDQLAEILPQNERSEETQTSGAAAFIPKDPFASPMVLMGVVTGSKGRSGGTGGDDPQLPATGTVTIGRADDVAIIRAGNTTFVVKLGEQILDYWTVKAIFPDSVIMVSHDREITLKLSASAEDLSPQAYTSSANAITMDLRNVDIRDALSALAIKLKVNIVYTESPVNVTMKLEGVTPARALELLTHKMGFAYAQQGQLIVVGNTNKLHTDFFNQMVLTRFNLIFVEARVIEPLIGQLSLPVKSITLEANEQAIWIQGTPQAILKMQELINAIDRPENASTEDEDDDISLAYRSLWTNVITPERVIQLLEDVGLAVDNYVILGSRVLIFDEDLFSRWGEIESLIREMDNMNASDYRAFAFELKNTVAGDASDRLGQFGFDSVTTITFNLPNFGREILVICPPQLESQVYNALVSIDANRKKIKAPITMATGENARDALIAKRKLLSELTGISVSSMYLSDNLSGDSDAPHYVLWIEETPDRIKLLNDYILQFDVK